MYALRTLLFNGSIAVQKCDGLWTALQVTQMDYRLCMLDVRLEFLSRLDASFNGCLFSLRNKLMGLMGWF